MCISTMMLECIPVPYLQSFERENHHSSRAEGPRCSQLGQGFDRLLAASCGIERAGETLAGGLPVGSSTIQRR